MSSIDPILLDIPVPFFSDRLCIRPLMPGDGQMVYDGVMSSIEELKPWMPWAHYEQDPIASEKRARSSYADWILRRDFTLVLLKKEDQSFVGCSGLHRIVWDTPSMEIGYWIKSDLAGQGYASEAARTIGKFAFDHLGARRVEIRCDEDNLASAAAAKKAGFELEATLKNDFPKPDRPEVLRNTLVFVRFD